MQSSLIIDPFAIFWQHPPIWNLLLLPGLGRPAPAHHRAGPGFYSMTDWLIPAVSVTKGKTHLKTVGARCPGCGVGPQTRDIKTDLVTIFVGQIAAEQTEVPIPIIIID